jgi:hypothetical protein
MARQPATRVGEEDAPVRRIADMQVGETAWTSPLAYISEKNGRIPTGRYFVEDQYTISMAKDGSNDMKITRLQTGFEVDLSESEAAIFE